MPSRPKIAHIMHHDGAGGGPVVATQLLEGLNDEYDQAAWCGGRGRIAQKCADLNLPFQEVRFLPVSESPVAYFELRSLLRKWRPDLVILHGQWAGPIGALAARDEGDIPSIYIAHCPAFYHSTTLARSVRNYIAEKIPCRYSRKVVTLSDGNYYNYLFRGWAPEKNLVKIHNGIDATKLPAPEAVSALRVKWSWDPKATHAVFVGRIDDQKRVDWLLEAWAAALHGSPSPPLESPAGPVGDDVRSRADAGATLESAAHLWIVGDGTEREKCETLARTLRISDSVHFVGPQPDGPAWIAASDFLILSSMYEGHALVPLEAMACAKPVAAFSTDGVSDSIVHNETGLLSDLGDTVALGSNIRKLLVDAALREKLGAAGYEKVLSQFSETSTLRKYRTLIQTVLTDEVPQKADFLAHP